MKFEWDPDKEYTNIEKHDVTFSEAETMLGAPFELTILDPDHPVGEFRFLSIARSSGNRLLVVSYTECEDRVRIISACSAMPKERRQYESS